MNFLKLKVVSNDTNLRSDSGSVASYGMVHHLMFQIQINGNACKAKEVKLSYLWKTI